MNRIAQFLGTGLYSGYFPIAPGTVGSAGALLCYLFIPYLRGVPLILVILAVFFIGVWAATRIEESAGHDASIINIDEIVGMWISLLFLPEQLKFWGWLAAFFLFRLFDILKPFPINQSQKLAAGWGVMVDDVLAGIYTFLVLRIVILLL